MKKFLFLCALFVSALAIVSCKNEQTYADQLERENNAINAYLVKNGIKVISENVFNQQNNTTDVSKNQFVLLSNSGVYLQILDKGTGTPIQDGENATVLARFTERNLLTDSIQLSNKNLFLSNVVEKMNVSRTGGSYTASFDGSSSLMASSYGNTSVPSGWLVALSYINLARIVDSSSKLAHVKLIVPSQQGQAQATNLVYPCLYEITFQRGL